MPRIITFGDSNTDDGFREPLSGSYEDNIVARSYVSTFTGNRLDPYDPHNEYQLAGMLEAGWASLYPEAKPLIAVNHGIGGSNTGDGITVAGSPGARYEVGGVTRFEAEVLGIGAPDWTFGSIARVRAFKPAQRDFAYISLGTNDCRYDVEYSETIENLRWMAEQWIAKELIPSHFLLATIPPTSDSLYCGVLDINDDIRALCTELDLTCIDLGAHTTTDGLTWIDPDMSVDPGDNSPGAGDVHYRASVREWIADQIIAAIAASAPVTCNISTHNHTGT